MTDISIVAGESRIINVAAQNEDGSPINLTGSTIAWQMALVPYGTPVISKAGVIQGPATDGNFRVTLSAAETLPLNGNFYQSAMITFPDTSKTSLFLGLIAISPLDELSSVEEFKVRYPEFAAVSNALISLVLADAALEVDEGWNESDISRARMLWAAHRLTIQGEPARSLTGQSIAITGPVKRHKVGDVEVEFTGIGGSSSSALDFGATSYGREYLRLLNMNFGGVRVLTGPNVFP